ncbi:hypothetical protein OS493_011761 [Desmophyllum pertusum]|uniref:Uncharacterized protein n=1 Tax=Desmophyllum pertusum TaxID=174260 RepID=A0A9X0CHI6_9CNID|nr:hypothetical protein OS493_011761 [Desmophyllum pertusum]
MDKEKVKSNSTYQKNMEKSFAVIYHNLQRIQATTTVARTRRHSQPEMPNPESSQRHPLIKKSNSVTPVSEKTNRKKEIDRYFSIIYHNLKRIQDNDVQPPEEERKQSQPEMTNPKSSQQLERYHFRERSHSVTQDRSHHTVAQKRSHSETQASTTTECRKVSFSFASKYEEGHCNESRMTNQLENKSVVNPKCLILHYRSSLELRQPLRVARFHSVTQDRTGHKLLYKIKSVS